MKDWMIYGIAGIVIVGIGVAYYFWRKDQEEPPPDGDGDGDGLVDPSLGEVLDFSYNVTWGEPYEDVYGRTVRKINVKMASVTFRSDADEARRFTWKTGIGARPTVDGLVGGTRGSIKTSGGWPPASLPMQPGETITASFTNRMACYLFGDEPPAYIMLAVTTPEEIEGRRVSIVVHREFYPL